MSWLQTDTPARELAFMAVVAIVLIALPWFLPLIGGYSELATSIVIFGVLALGFDILVGFTGFLSFGHAAFWGIGSYTAGLYLLHVANQSLVAMLCSVIVVTVVAFVLALITLRRSGIYFAILTLAFAEMFYFLALSPLSGITGGDNGLTGIPDPQLLGALTLESMGLYAFTAAWAFLSIYLARRIKRSPYGLMLRAIKTNETRLTYTGINVFRYKVMAFVISGMFGGLAGSLATLHETYVAVSSLHWTTSGEIVMMAVVGGFGTLVGPMIGAGIVLYLENVLSALTAQWYLILGLIFMAFVIFLPGGVMEAGRWLVNACRRSGKPKFAAAPAQPHDSDNSQSRISSSQPE